MTPLTIGKLARASEVKIDTIRYYERQGLVTPEARTGSAIVSTAWKVCAGSSSSGRPRTWAFR